jgi:hypothetical protein
MKEMLPAARGIELGHARNEELSEIEQYSGPGVWPTREAAQECSPRRQPWVVMQRLDQLQRGGETSLREPPAAKRRQNAAHGASRGWSRNNEQAPEGREKLAPKIFLIVSNVILLEKCQKLVLKRMLLMMFFLRGDIFCHCRYI